MICVDQSNPQWLQQVLERAVAEGWCTRMNCTTCASEDLRLTLGLLDKSAGRPRFLPMTTEDAEAIVAGLAACAPQGAAAYRLEEPARWVIYELWRNFGDQYFSTLDGTWSGNVLSRMRTHYESRQEARRIHAARQGVKQRDWKE
jgi:hypothetical protein